MTHRKNTRIINHWLQTKGINHPTYPDFETAFQELSATGAIEVDYDAQQPTAFKGALTKKTFYSIDEMIGAERQAALNQVIAPSQDEVDFQNLPSEQALPLIREAEKQAHNQLSETERKRNADAWLILHPEFVDSERNAHLMAMQLRLNGVIDGETTIADYELASRQLRESELLKLDPKVVRKQQAEELQQRADAATKIPGSIFDTTTEEEMYDLPLDELKRRANGNYSGI